MKKLYFLAFCALVTPRLIAEVESSAERVHTPTPTPTPIPAPSKSTEPTEAQPKLPTIPLKIGTATVTAEVADNDKSRTMGLMFRKGLEKDHGMLFVMSRVGPVGFWMKNTSIPLSIAYINPDGRIMEIHDLEPFNEKTVRSQFPNILYALEMRRGWFSDNAIFPGTAISGLPSLR